MSNAKTEHSRRLRQKSAAAYQSKITAANRFEIRNKDATKIAAIKSGLAEMDGADNAEKILLLLNNYKKGKK